MLVVETTLRIRRDHLVRGVPIKKIARDLRVSKNTVRKVVRGDETSYSYPRKIQPMPKLGPWVDELERQLEANEKKARRDRLSLLRIHEDLASLGYGGGYDAVRRYARVWRRRHRLLSSSEAYVPLIFDPGEAYQFDWSHEYAVLSGTTTRVSGEDIVRLILDGTGVKARLDGRVLSIPLLVVLGVRRDGQKVLLAVKNMGGETEAAWRHVLEDLLGRGLKAPELLIVDGGKGLEAALASLWSDIPVQRCTVHKERNLLAHAPKALHDEVKADYTDMMYAENAEQVRKKRKAFLAKWRLRCRGVADSLEEAGERLFTFLRYPPQQWKSLRTTNAIERLHGEFKRRVKTQCALPNAETAAMLFWALMASGQITMRRVGGWQTLDQAPVKKPIDLAA